MNSTVLIRRRAEATTIFATPTVATRLVKHKMTVSDTCGTAFFLSPQKNCRPTLYRVANRNRSKSTISTRDGPSHLVGQSTRPRAACRRHFQPRMSQFCTRPQQESECEHQKDRELKDSLSTTLQHSRPCAPLFLAYGPAYWRWNMARELAQKELA